MLMSWLLLAWRRHSARNMISPTACKSSLLFVSHPPGSFSEPRRRSRCAVPAIIDVGQPVGWRRRRACGKLARV